MKQKDTKKQEQPTPQAPPEGSESRQPELKQSGLRLPKSSGHIQRMILPEGITLTKGARQEVMKQHRAWQNELIKLVKQGSQVVVGAEGGLEHVMPSKLISLVWRTSIDQRVKWELQQQERAGIDSDIATARSRAIASIQDEMDDAIAQREAFALVKAARAISRAKQQAEAAAKAEEQSEN